MATAHVLVVVFPDREAADAAAQALYQAGLGMPQLTPVEVEDEAETLSPPPRVDEDQPRGTLAGFGGEGSRLTLEVPDQRLTEALLLVEACHGVAEVTPVAHA